MMSSNKLRVPPVPSLWGPGMRVPPVPSIWGPGMEAPLHPNLPIGVFSKSMKGQRVRYQQTEDFHSPGLQQFPASAIPVDGGGEGAF